MIMSLDAGWQQEHELCRVAAAARRLKPAPSCRLLYVFQQQHDKNTQRNWSSSAMLRDQVRLDYKVAEEQSMAASTMQETI
jgi:hypothetical protein